MKRIDPKEKRLHPRIDRSLPVKVVTNGYDFTTTTENISCVGAYCRIDRYVPPFTRVMIKLALPFKENEEAENCQLECTGVIVRSKDNPEGGFNIAIFFNKIQESQRKKISRYVNQFLPA